jgi:mutator protein MutT
MGDDPLSSDMMPGDLEQPIRVGIGLIGRGGSYLIRRRPPGSAMAGLWEFPGGKCEPGESLESATARECLEEVGVEVEVGELVHRVVHRYPHGLIAMNYYRCSTDGEPAPDSGFAWIPACELPHYPFPEANDAVVAALAREGVGTTGAQRDEP